MAPPPCVAARVVPRAEAIPANLPGFGYTALKAQASDIHLYAGPEKTEVPLTVGPVVDGLLKVVPQTPLVPGTTYELSFEPFCHGAGHSVTPIRFTAAPEAPLPSQVGEVQGAPTVALEDFGTTRFTIEGTYALAAEMKPWVAVHQLTLLFDGRPIETRPTVDGDTLRIVATGWCTENDAKSNQHSVVLRATLPFAPPAETAPTTMEFTCPAPRIRKPAAGGNPTPPPGSGTSPAPGATTPPPASSDSGSCTMLPAGRSWLAPALVSLVGLAAAVRRRLSGASAAERRR